MYSRQEASILTQEFWTVFGQYMSPVVSAEGQKINWINYKTGEKDVFFRMQATGKTASVTIEIRHKDPVIRQLFFEQFLSYKSLFNSIMEEEWTWNLQDQDENGKLLSRVYISITPANILKKEDWPLMISFFKSRITRLDQFWAEVKYGFELLH